MRHKESIVFHIYFKGNLSAHSVLHFESIFSFLPLERVHFLGSCAVPLLFIIVLLTIAANECNAVPS